MMSTWARTNNARSAERLDEVAAIWRYPIKSMAGERLESIPIDANGLPGDRVVQVYDRRGRLVTARNYPRLLRLKATLGSDGEPARRQLSMGFRCGVRARGRRR